MAISRFTASPFITDGANGPSPPDVIHICPLCRPHFSDKPKRSYLDKVLFSRPKIGSVYPSIEIHNDIDGCYEDFRRNQNNDCKTEDSD